MRNRNIYNTAQHFAIAWGKFGSHIFSVNTDYKLIYTERILYTFPHEELALDDIEPPNVDFMSNDTVTV